MRSLIVAVGRYSGSPPVAEVDEFAAGDGAEEQAPTMSSKAQEKKSERKVLITDLYLHGVKHRSKVRTYNVQLPLEKSAESF
jgi:hypothetical protein